MPRRNGSAARRCAARLLRRLLPCQRVAGAASHGHPERWIPAGNGAAGAGGREQGETHFAVDGTGAQAAGVQRPGVETGWRFRSRQGAGGRCGGRDAGPWCCVSPCACAAARAASAWRQKTGPLAAGRGQPQREKARARTERLADSARPTPAELTRPAAAQRDGAEKEAGRRRAVRQRRRHCYRQDSQPALGPGPGHSAGEADFQEAGQLGRYLPRSARPYTRLLGPPAPAPGLADTRARRRRRHPASRGQAQVIAPAAVRPCLISPLLSLPRRPPGRRPRQLTAAAPMALARHTLLLRGPLASAGTPRPLLHTSQPSRRPRWAQPPAQGVAQPLPCTRHGLHHATAAEPRHPLLQVVGYVILNTNGLAVHVAKLAVRDDFRRRGIALQLFRVSVPA